MAVIIDMPKLSDTMSVGTLVRWIKQEGDTVQPGDMIAEVETDKATMELENFESGVLLKQYVKEGSQVAVGTAICAVGVAGEAVPEVAVPETQQEVVAQIAPVAPAPRAFTPPPPPAVAPKPQIASVAAQEGCGCAAGPSRLKASPLAKKIAKEHSLNLNIIGKGSGPDGRIVKKDILDALSNPGLASAGTGGHVSKLEERQEAVSNIRGTIARRLLESKTQVPHFYLDVEVAVDDLLKTRAQLNDYFTQSNQAFKLTVNDFILKATAQALALVPEVNASWYDTVVHYHGSVHLAFGVAIDDGLVTPTIRDAQSLSLMALSQQAKQMIKKARDRKLTPNEMSGSTFTVTNLGMYGVENFYGIINPPNAGILSVGAASKKPVVDDMGNICVGQRMKLGFSGDHRVVDGAKGAEFLTAIKQFLEMPALLLV